MGPEASGAAAPVEPKMEFEEMIAVFCGRLRIGLPAPDEKGRYTFVIDDAFTVHFLPGGRSEIILTGAPGRVPGQDGEAEALLRRLLKINLARMRVQSGVLSMEESGEIVLHRAVSMAAVTPGDFEGILESFVNEMAFWRHAMRESAGPAMPSPAILLP